MLPGKGLRLGAMKWLWDEREMMVLNTLNELIFFSTVLKWLILAYEIYLNKKMYMIQHRTVLSTS